MNRLQLRRSGEAWVCLVLVALGLLLDAITSSAKDLEAINGTIPSPDGAFVVYKTPLNVSANDEWGTKVYVREAGRSKKAKFLLASNRWMAAEWAPKSHLLGIEDHNDGHVSDVYVYEIEAAKKGGAPSCRLVFRSPEAGYDIKWYIEGWDVANWTIQLREEKIRHPVDASGNTDYSENLGAKTVHRTFKIGAKWVGPTA